MGSESMTHYNRWMEDRVFLNIQIIDLQGSHLGAPDLCAEIYALERSHRYLLYRSPRKPSGAEVVWISSQTEPISLRIRASTSLVVLVYSGNKILGETRAVRVLKEVASPKNCNDVYNLEQVFGSYPVLKDSRVLMGGCKFTIRFDTRGDYRRPEQADGLQAFETVSVGHQKTLRWFLDVMTILFDDPWPLPVQLSWLVLSKVWHFHSFVHPTLEVHGKPASDVLSQMKALLFSLKTSVNLHALKVAADHIETVFKGNVPGTIGDLARLTKLPNSLRERLEDIPLYVDKGLLPELTSFIVSELCMSVFVLEELMWEYRNTYLDIASSPLNTEVVNRQRGLFQAQFRATMFLSQNCSVSIRLHVKLVAEILLYYITEETAIPDHLRHFTHSLVSARGPVADEVQELLHTAVTFVEVTASRNKLRRVLTTLAQRSSRAPSFLYLDDVTVNESIGGGGFADVFAGQWGEKRVAVKSLKALKLMPDDHLGRAHLFREIITWKTMNHPRVLEFHGVADLPSISEICMISPLMDRSTVRKRFYLENGETGYGDLNVAPPPADEHLRQRIIKEIVDGMTYIHSEGVVHGDLRADNIFLDDEDHVKIADFGLCVFSEGISRNYFSMRSGNARWLAPELIDSQQTADPNSGTIRVHRPRPSCDVFSFACVCIELYSYAAPYAHLISEVAVIHFVTSQVNGAPGRPNRPHALVNDDLWALMQRCWNANSEGRPCFPDIAAELQGVLPDT